MTLNITGQNNFASGIRFKDFRKPLEQAAAKWFEKRGNKVRFGQPFILYEKASWAGNIILPEVAGLLRDLNNEREGSGKAFPLHDFIHHGLSSQAMLFNLVGPLMIADDLDAMRGAFETNGINWPFGKVKAHVEVEDRAVFNERQKQPTSVDLVITSQPDSTPLYIEFKFVETGFGGCSIFKNGKCEGANPMKDLSTCYLHQIGRTYWQHLEKWGFFDGPLKDGPICAMSCHYQFFRELLFALHKGGNFILVVDDRNPVFNNRGSIGLWPLLQSYIPADLHKRVYKISTQDIVEAVVESGHHGYWIEEFMEKYGLS